MRTLHQRVREAIRRHRMVQAGERLGVGVSGGADSVALLRLLEELKGELGIQLLVLHFNHQLRGMESDEDERFVAELASRRGHDFVFRRGDVAAEARRRRGNLEDAARRLRYQFFSEIVDSGRATRVAVGHTADDQAETVLAHLIRGTGPTGLAAIHPRVGCVIRPLLEIRRQQLRDYLSASTQPWREDPTNRDTTRLRARIRHLLLPRLETEFPPGVVPHLSQLAALAREDETFWKALLTNRYQTLVEHTSAGRAIRVADLLAPLPLDPTASRETGESRGLEAVSKRLVRRIVQELRGDSRQLTARHVEQVLHLACACSSGQRTFLPGVVVERVFDRLVFSLSKPPGPQFGQDETGLVGQPYQYVVEWKGESSAMVSVPEIGRLFRLKLIDWPPTPSDTILQAEALDADRLRAPLILRSWRPGDSYRPRGHRRVHKLKRLLVESRVPLRERVGWPVLTSAGTLVWARGLPVAEEFAPQGKTKAGVVIDEEAL